MSAKRKYRKSNEYLKYLKGELSSRERHDFERDLQADPFEMEALEGMEQIPAAEIEEDLLILHDRLNKRLKRRRRRRLYYVAASVASLLIVGTIFLNIYDINPEKSSESIPRDESFLHEDAPEAEQGVSEMEDLQPDEDFRAVEEQEKVAPEETILEAEAPVRQDEAPVKQAEAQARQVKAPAQQAEAQAQARQAAAPVSVTPESDELVVVEAQPDAARKKGRALEPEAQQPEVQQPEVQKAEVQEAEVQNFNAREYDAMKEAVAAGEIQQDMAGKDLRPKPSPAGQLSGIVVSSEDMEPLPGASILVKGSDSGIVADNYGRFSLVADQQKETTIIASYVGMETGEFKLASGRENQVLMHPDQSSLDEVVVLGSEVDQQLYPAGAVQRINLDQEEFNYNGAEPEGGLPAFKMYIEEQIRFPAGDTLIKKEVVVLKFNVSREGSISNIQTLRSPGPAFTGEAIRLLNEGPSWKPARNESGVTEDVVRMRIVFKK